MLKGLRTEEPRFDSQVRQQYFLISSPKLSHRLWGTHAFLCNWYRSLFPRGWRRTWSLPLACIKSRETLPPLTHTPPWHGKWSQHRDFTFTLTLRRYSETTHTANYTHGLWLYQLWKGWYCLYRSKTSYYFYLKLFSLFNKINNFGSVQSCDQSSNNTFRWNAIVECKAVLWNWRFLGLNSARRGVIPTEDFRGFPQPIQANVGKASQIRARQFPFTFSLIHSSLISYHSTPYIERLKYFVKETINNFQSVIRAAYPQRQTRPAERKITKKYNENSSLLRYCAASIGEEIPGIRRGARFRFSRALSPGQYVKNACTVLRYLASRSWTFTKNTSCSHVKDVEQSPTVFSGNEREGIVDKALSVLCLKDVSDFDIPSSVALEILVKTGQCLAKFQTDTPIRIYICKPFGYIRFTALQIQTTLLMFTFSYSA